MKWASRGSLPFMKMLYPRKMDEVLWHSTTCLFSKSILVKMPRLPTIRVIGSQFISTRFLFLLGTSLVGAVTVLIRRSFGFSVEWSVRSRVVSGGQFRAGMSPLRFFIDGILGYRAQSTNGSAICTDRCGGDSSSRRFIHKGHEL